MGRVARIVVVGLAGVTMVAALGVGGVLWTATRAPATLDLALPSSAVALSSPEGQALLEAAARADHLGLMERFEPQERGAWCGVASSVAVLGARGVDLTQDEFFVDEVRAVRSWWATTLMGMPLDALALSLEAHGAQVETQYADRASVAAFRSELRANLAQPGDWIIVNYHREVLDQEGGGHFSPLAALSADGEWVLVLDTAGHKYAPHWVEVPALFAAMDTVDSESGRSRGWVVVQ